MATLGDLIKGKIPEVEESLHRTKKRLTRPDTEVALNSLAKESTQHAKTQKDPTDDLVEVGVGEKSMPVSVSSGYLVWCETTLQLWYAPTKRCLDKNFIYREDLIIKEVTSESEATQFYDEHAKECQKGITTCKVCYILDNPCNETYEVYADSAYPAQHYGKATPQGCFIHRYPNRFHRDMAILELDDLYSNSSTKQAGKFIAKEFKPNEAVIVSDGAWMKETCTYSFFYLDEHTCVKQTAGFAPSEEDQAVLIAEISGAYNAIKMCVDRGKKKIKYYYDNTSIMNVFKNRKTEYIIEIKMYKDYLNTIYSKGYDVEFIELHPKTAENKDAENKALMLFHNTCDNECRTMSDIVAKGYKGHAKYDSKKGTMGSTFIRGKQNNNNNNRRR